MDASVAIPIQWFVGVITTLSGVIGYITKELFKLQNIRVEETRKDTERVVTALNNNTNALTQITDALEAGSK